MVSGFNREYRLVNRTGVQFVQNNFHVVIASQSPDFFILIWSKIDSWSDYEATVSKFWKILYFLVIFFIKLVLSIFLIPEVFEDFFFVFAAEPINLIFANLSLSTIIPTLPHIVLLQILILLWNECWYKMTVFTVKHSFSISCVASLISVKYWFSVIWSPETVHGLVLHVSTWFLSPFKRSKISSSSVISAKFSNFDNLKAVLLVVI